MNRSTKKKTKTNTIRQSAVIEAEIKEVDLQLEQLADKKASLSRALLLAVEDETKDEADERGDAASQNVPSEGLRDAETGEDVEERVLNSLSWRPFRSGKKGEWTFATDRSGNLMTPLERSRTLVAALRDQRRVSLGGYHYRMSQDGKFLHRFPTSD